MGKILGIAIQNFGVLKNVRLGQFFKRQKDEPKDKPLGNMVAVVGENGAGKSSLADAFGFVSDCLATDVAYACDANNRCGFERLRSRGSSGPIRFEIYYRESEDAKTPPITYELAIDADASGRPFVAEERLRQRRTKNGRGYPLTFLHLTNGRGFVYAGAEGGEKENGESVGGQRVDVEFGNARKLGVATLGEMKNYERVEKFLAFLRNWYLCYFAPDAARQLQTGAPAPRLNRTGSNLNNVAQYMFRENNDEFKKVLAEIQTKIPSVERIEPFPLPNGQIALQFYQNEAANDPFYSSRMSDGTLKLFAYYLLLHEKNPRRLVFVEEPENGLYHRYLPDLATEMAKSAGPDKQIFVTTHSPFFVDALRPESVWVLSKGADGFSVAKRASDFEFVDALYAEDVRLGDLWRNEYLDRPGADERLTSV